MYEPQTVARSSGGVIYRSGGLPSVGRTRRDTARAVEHEHGKAEVAVARVNGAAYVTHTAQFQAALLSREEEQLIQLAPMGELRYSALVNAYTTVAAGIILGMGR